MAAKKDLLAELYRQIPIVPCDGCHACCDGTYPSTVACPYFRDNVCSVYGRRPISCRLYGTVRPCLAGRVASPGLTQAQADAIAAYHRQLTGRSPFSTV